MRIKPDWFRWLHDYRTRGIALIFGRCPDGLFAEGLELGAGDGFQSGLLGKYVRHLVATDINSAILRLPAHDGVGYQVLDAEDVGDHFPPGLFDLVFSSSLLEHLPAPERALAGVCRVLKDAGVTIHIVPSPFWKLCELLLYFPNPVVLLLERVLVRGGGRVVAEKNGRHTHGGAASTPIPPEADNNPKVHISIVDLSRIPMACHRDTWRSFGPFGSPAGWPSFAGPGSGWRWSREGLWHPDTVSGWAPCAGGWNAWASRRSTSMWPRRQTPQARTWNTYEFGRWRET